MENLIKNFSSLSLSNINSDKEINTTYDFLCLNKSQIEKDSEDYNTMLFYLFYMQASKIYEDLKTEYTIKRKKMKLDILEDRYNNKINKLLYQYEQKEIYKNFLFSKNMIDIELSYKMEKTKKVVFDDIEFIPDEKKTTMDKIENQYLIEYIIDKIGVDVYSDLVNYYSNNDVKTPAERQKNSRLIKQLQSII